MVGRIKSTVSRNLINIFGWRTNKKIIVIESDDWGSIRMPSQETYSRFVSSGFNISGSVYNRLDTLESNTDLEQLYEVLSIFKDSNGNPPVFTANVVVGNPDFKKIRESGFKKYFFEPVIETLKQYHGRNKVEFFWKQGNSEGIFHPQFHGREHVNVIRWMENLQKKSPEILIAFENNTTLSGNGDYNFMEVLDYNTPDDLEEMKISLKEGLSLFENIFGYRSKSFIPPCYIWSNEIEETLYKEGIRYIQGLILQSVPTGKFGTYKGKYHYLGKRNSYGQRYLIRNCFFEPSLLSISDPVGECLKSINIAFKWGKPAIICSHRVNFIGTLVRKNSSNNLMLLNELLKQIIKQWPEIEFMTSDQLGELIDTY